MTAISWGRGCCFTTPVRGRGGKVISLENKTSDGDGKQVRVVFSRDVVGVGGDVMTWDTGRQRFRGVRGAVVSPACDDLAGVAAALGAFDA